MISIFFEAIDAIMKKSNAENDDSQTNLKILRKNTRYVDTQRTKNCNIHV